MILKILFKFPKGAFLVFGTSTHETSNVWPNTTLSSKTNNFKEFLPPSSNLWPNGSLRLYKFGLFASSVFNPLVGDLLPVFPYFKIMVATSVI